MTGRDVLKTNGVWQIGNGQRIIVFQDSWVPGLRGHKLQPNGDAEQDEAKVDQLIMPGTRRWNLDKIRLTITEEERDAIKAIYLRREPGEDKLV